MAVKKTKKTATKTEEKPPVLVEPGNFTMVLSTEEMMSAVQILGLAKDIFGQAAVDSRAAGNEKSAAVFLARSELSLMLYRKFRDVARIGEPESGLMH